METAIPDERSAEEARLERGGLRKLAASGSRWELASYGATQVLRLVSNLVLTRLLFPEAFGLIALMGVFLQGLAMLSDVGVQQAVIQDRRGDDARFLDTAWTIQVLRGLGLWLASFVVAWPAAEFCKKPELAWLIPMGGLSAVIRGFGSTSELTFRRHVRLRPLMQLEVGSQAVALVVTVGWALVSPTVWALVAGTLASAFARTIWTTRLSPWPGYANRFCWDAESRRSIRDFGKWIFGSSAVCFVSNQGDRFLLGRYIDASTLGIYQLAIFLSEALGMVVDRLVHGVFYSVFSRARDEGADRLRAIFYATRLQLDALTLPAVGFVAVTGPWIVDLLYDPRYAAAGPMLQVLSLRTATSVVLSPTETCLTSIGLSRYGFFNSVARAVWVVLATPAGWYLGGIEGVVWAVASTGIPSFFVLFPPMARRGLLRPSRELLAASFFAVGALIGHGLLEGLPDAWR